MNTQAIRLPISLIKEAKSSAAFNMRTVPAQISYWAKIGRAAEDNPDLPLDFIINVLKAKEDIDNGDVSPFVFGDQS